jgi:hypothetical protein
MHLGLLGELKTFHAALAREASGAAVDPRLWSGGGHWLPRPLFRIWHARYLKQLRMLLDIEMGPRPRPVWAEPPPRMSLLPPLGGAGLHRSLETGDHVISALGLAELAVALRRFRLAHGEYPPELSAVVPAYVANVPADPLTGQPPIYTRQGAGFTLQRGTNASGTIPRLSAAARDWTVLK